MDVRSLQRRKKATEGCGIRRDVGGGSRRGKELASLRYIGKTFFFFKQPGLASSAATELRQYKLPEGPVLREVVLKEKIRERY